MSAFIEIGYAEQITLCASTFKVAHTGQMPYLSDLLHYQKLTCECDMQSASCDVIFHSMS